jgi:hypothetical protein
MPFELGLAVAWEKVNAAKLTHADYKHSCFVFEAKKYRIIRSLSDLNGIDPLIHSSQVIGVMRELCNAFVRERNQPSVPEMMRTYRIISRRLPKIMADAGAKSLFEARAFQDLCYEAKLEVDLRSSGLTR